MKIEEQNKMVIRQMFAAVEREGLAAQAVALPLFTQAAGKPEQV
jgi:hypothetical protein